MPRSHVFHEIFLHVNWHCHEDHQMILPEREPILFHLIQEYCRKYNGIFFMDLGGTETHVHLAVQLEPIVAPADFIGKIKGFSAHEMNKQFGSETIKWQRGYGIVSFAAANLPAIQKYIQMQKEHHSKSRIRDKLERYYVDLPEGVYVPNGYEKQEY